MKSAALCLIALVVLTGFARDARAQGAAPPDLARATLEELMNISITTASRATESLADAAARVQVVTAAQIQRRGYRSLSDVLKDLPDFKVDLAGNWDFPAELTVQATSPHSPPSKTRSTDAIEASTSARTRAPKSSSAFHRIPGGSPLGSRSG